MNDDLDSKKKAVALKYDSDVSDAPKVVGKGRGIIAEEIISIAK